jgi:SAM-dependent methyltransferase
MTSASSSRCRSCGADAVGTVLDLGTQPVADDLLEDREQARAAPRHRLALGSCARCGLVQLDAATPLLANAAHGHGSAFSGTVLQHEQDWAAELLSLPGLREGSRVLDVGSGTGGLLQFFAGAGLAVQGWERDPALAEQATAAGLPTAPADGAIGGRDDGLFDLVLANHTLSHADDLDTAVATLARSLAPGGTVAVEFHSATGILTGGQFDVVCHAHRSYLTLTALQGALGRHGLTVTSARTLPLHGGVVRLLAQPTATGGEPDTGVLDLLAAERSAGVGSREAWAGVADRAARVRTRLRAALAEHLAAGRTVAAYGAPSRGTTLLNSCGIDVEQIPRTADRSPAKQGRFLPGAGTAVCSPQQLADQRPDVLLVLVWPLRAEVLAQLDDLRRAGTRFLFPLPELEMVT